MKIFTYTENDDVRPVFGVSMQEVTVLWHMLVIFYRFLHMDEIDSNWYGKYVSGECIGSSWNLSFYLGILFKWLITAF